MSDSCKCCVLSPRGLYVGLITRPEEIYRVWCQKRMCCLQVYDLMQFKYFCIHCVKQRTKGVINVVTSVKMGKHKVTSQLEHEN